MSDTANPTEPVIKNMTDGRYELHCPVCGESVIPPLPLPMDEFSRYIKRFQAAHKHDGRETPVSERAN